MNLHTSITPTLSFKSSMYDKYFDNPMDFEEEHRIIPEYEDLDTPVIDSEDVDTQDMFRQDELFDRKRDEVDFRYRGYGTDDVEFCNNIKMRNVPTDMRHFSSYFEGGRTERDAWSDYYRANSAINTYTVDNAWKRKHESFQERLNQGFERADISTIYHFSLLDTDYDKKRMDLDLADKGFKLLKNGKGIFEVASVMDGSKLSRGDGSKKFSPQLFEFLSVYPDARPVVVERKNRYESLRSNVMDIYPSVKEVCSQEGDAIKVIKACENDDLNLSREYTERCLNSIKEGYDVDTVTKAMKNSKLSQGYGRDTVFDENLYGFLLDYPKAKSYVVTEERGNKYFREDLADAYKEISGLCDYESDISKVMDSCTINNKYDEQTPDRNLLALAKKLLEKDSEWSQKHSKIIESAVKKSRYGTKVLDIDKFKLAKTMADGDYSVNSIYSVTVLKLKNPELCK